MEKYNLIILEGIDKSGKTTIAEKILKSIKNSILIKGNCKPIDNSKQESKKIREYYKTILKLTKNNFLKDKTIIVDRYYPSQMVYSIKRGKDEFRNKWFKQFEDKICNIKSLYIYIRPEDSVLKQRLEVEKDEYIGIEDLQGLLERYDKFYENTKLNKIKINTFEQIQW